MVLRYGGRELDGTGGRGSLRGFCAELLGVVSIPGYDEDRGLKLCIVSLVQR